RQGQGFQSSWRRTPGRADLAPRDIRILVVDADVEIAEAVQGEFEACRPLTDRPGEDVVADDIAWAGPAERQILEIAGECREVLAHFHSADFSVDKAIRHIDRV